MSTITNHNNNTNTIVDNKEEESTDQQQQQQEEEEITMNTTTITINKLGGYEFFEKVLKSPKKIVAPMVDHTYLAFRMLCRKYGADVVYTPMFHSKNFATCKTYRKDNFSTCPQDRPLVVQFCGNEPEWVVKAAKFVENQCDAIDLNLGCPQQIARRGNYGSFLLEKPHIILPIVRELHKNIKVPIFCKIRLLPKIEDTIKLALQLEEAGCQLLTVHGRTKEQKGQFAGTADWKAINQVRAVLKIPVIANGSVLKYSDIEECLKVTGADGVMSAEGILADPSMFSGLDVDILQVCRDYLDLCDTYTTNIFVTRSHLFKMLKERFDYYTDLRDQMSHIRTLDGFRELLVELENRIKSGAPGNKLLTNKEKRERLAREKELGLNNTENNETADQSQPQQQNENLDNNNNNNNNNTNTNNDIELPD
eukprot:gene10307-12648_t